MSKKEKKFIPSVPKSEQRPKRAAMVGKSAILYNINLLLELMTWNLLCTLLCCVVAALTKHENCEPSQFLCCTVWLWTMLTKMRAGVGIQKV